VVVAGFTSPGDIFGPLKLIAEFLIAEFLFLVDRGILDFKPV
jgi:hypothetical protein